MTPLYTLRRATRDEFDTVAGLITGRVRWIGEQGGDQWSVKDPVRETATSIQAGETWLLTDPDGDAVATVTASTVADLDFWTADELVTPSLYVTKLATSPSVAGAGLGELVLLSLYQHARRLGVASMRGDVWRNNPRLHDYYLALGARKVRTVEVPGRNTGTVFEWGDATGISGALNRVRPADRVTVDAAIGVVAVADTERHDRTTTIGEGSADPEGFQGTPSHTHTTLDLLRENGEPFRITDTQAEGLILHNPGDGWRTRVLTQMKVTLADDPTIPAYGLGYAPERVSGAFLDQLKVGRLYEVKHIGRWGQCGVAAFGELVPDEPQPVMPGDAFDRQSS